MNPRFIILADDLSGATDCAVPFARSGFSTEVFLQPEFAAQTDSTVASIDLNTRELSPSQALEVTSRALRLLPSNPETVWYRKIDSTLRGNIGADVLSTAEGILDKRVVICAPAFPDTGRITVDGGVFVNGMPLDKSGIGTEWSGDKSVTDLFKEVGMNTQFLSLEVIRSGCPNIVRHLKSGPGLTVTVCDAETNLDLLAIAEAGLQMRKESIFVGSAGLAQQIAKLLGSERNVNKQIVLTGKPILVVVGSKSSVSRAQFDFLSNLTGIEVLRMPVKALQSESDPLLIDGLSQALALGRDVAITTDLCGSSISHRRGVELMDFLGRTLRSFLPSFAALVLTGGETARALLSRSEIGRLLVIDELEPGVTLSVAAGPPPLAIVMKAGAFGNPATLLNAVHFLRGRKK
jgi:D-threonate/D-erythronate kinase